MHARTVASKLRYADFSTITRSRTVQHARSTAPSCFTPWPCSSWSPSGQRPMTVRLVGIRAEQLEEAAQAPLQLSLDRRDDNWRAAEQALDRVTRKFGNKSVLPARLLDPGSGELPADGHMAAADTAAGRPSVFQNRAATNYPYIYIGLERLDRAFGLTACQLNTRMGPWNRHHPANDGEREPLGNPGRYGFRAHGHVSPDVGRLKEVVMPLSEHEQKLLEQLEKQLHEDDPKFASSMGSDPGRIWSTRHLVIGVLGALAGIAAAAGRRLDCRSSSSVSWALS